MPPTKLPLLRVVLIGLVLPISLAGLDHWLLAREFLGHRDTASAQAMVAFVLQVGLYGVLCGRLIELPWLRWLLFAWCLLFTDLNAAASLNDRIPQSLFTAQIGLVTVWAVLGTASWKIRLPVVLLLIVPMLAMITQTAALCLICLVMRSQGFRLALSEGEAWAEAYMASISALGPQPAIRRKSAAIQFGIRDVLLWTTALAPLLAVSRLGAWRQLTEGVLHAIVLVVALWTALGQGSAWIRWPVLALFTIAAGAAWADFELYVTEWFRMSTGKPPFWDDGHLNYLWWRLTEPWQNAWLPFLLAAGMLAATLLIYRVLGYRLCRLRPLTPDARFLTPG